VGTRKNTILPTTSNISGRVSEPESLGHSRLPKRPRKILDDKNDPFASSDKLSVKVTQIPTKLRDASRFPKSERAILKFFPTLRDYNIELSKYARQLEIDRFNSEKRLRDEGKMAEVKIASIMSSLTKVIEKRDELEKRVKYLLSLLDSKGIAVEGPTHLDEIRVRDAMIEHSEE
jgi:hypothetical protein